MRVGILTAGGDCPGLNAAIRGVARSAHEAGDEPVGIRKGFQGLAEGELHALEPADVSGIISLGGTILSTSSFDPFSEGAVDAVVETVGSEDLGGVVTIGGEHTMELARRLHEERQLPIVGVPKTIDNDVNGTDVTFGYDTAAEIATEAIDRLRTTAQSHDRVIVVEVMGRYTGWIALRSGIAGGADAILIPERDTPIEDVAEGVVARSERGKHFSVIVVAEGARLCFRSGETRTVSAYEQNDPYGYPRLGGIATAVASELESRTGFQTRVTILGHVQRGGTPTAADRFLASALGAKAYDLASAGETGTMAAVNGGSIVGVPLAETAGVREADAEIQRLADRLSD